MQWARSFRGEPALGQRSASLALHLSGWGRLAKIPNSVSGYRRRARVAIRPGDCADPGG